MQDFTRLKVWRSAHELVLVVYRESDRFPASERMGLTPQMRRAAASIAANIAEGCGRDGPRELARFLRIAMASACELEYHLLLAADLEMLPRPTHTELAQRVSGLKRMLTALIRCVRATPSRRSASVGSSSQPPETPVTTTGN